MAANNLFIGEAGDALLFLTIMLPICSTSWLNAAEPEQLNPGTVKHVRDSQAYLAQRENYFIELLTLALQGYSWPEARVVLSIPNPMLPAATPLNNRHRWFSIDNLQPGLAPN